MKKIKIMVCILLVLITSSIVQAAPALNFSDLISGPDSGLNDGSGEGAIVTIWGNRLGSTQGTSTITVCGTTPAHVYYWKDADGSLPSGPADLSTSHGMQEVAFSIPSSCSVGATTISVTVGGETSNTLPFTVRSGNIYHAMTTGSATAAGSYADPFLSIDEGGLGALSAGDILYLHDGVSDTNTYGNTGVLVSGDTATESTQRAIVTYPNSTYTITGTEKIIDFYNSDSFVLSKFSAEGGYYDEPASSSTTILGKTGGHGIEGSPYSRLVANKVTDIAGKCSSGYGGAIYASCGGGDCDPISSLKVFGNYIVSWGCPQTSHFEHTTYFSIRNEGFTDVSPWEIGWNHLQDNDAKYGIHNYDETYDVGCGSPTGTVKVHNNYINNQKGAGINIGSKANNGFVCWDSGQFDVYNNIVIESGKGPADENGSDLHGIRIGDAGMGIAVRVFNNTVYGWGDDSLGPGSGIKTYETGNSGWATITITNNIFYDTRGGDYTGIVESTYSNVSGSNNIFYSTGGASSSVDSRLTGNIFDNPDFVSAGSDFAITDVSPAVNSGTVGLYDYDVSASRRAGIYDIGAYEYIVDAQKIIPPTLNLIKTE